MDQEFANRINEEIERYKNALLNDARENEWQGFKSKAGKHFDYLEGIELSEIQRKFSRMFKIILVVLVMIIVIILKMNGEAYPALLRFKDSMVITAIAGSCFEPYFFMDFRLYVEHKISWYKHKEGTIHQGYRERFQGDHCSIRVNLMMSTGKPAPHWRWGIIPR